MTDKIKPWWSDDGKWFCILVNDGVNQATVSLTPDEAKGLFALASPADGDTGVREALVKALEENQRLFQGIQKLRRVFWSGVDVDKDAVCVACLELFAAAHRSRE